MTPNRRSIRALLAVGVLSLASCTYAEGKRVVDFDYAVTADGSMAAVLVHHRWRQMPTGIAAFPAGGSPKITEEYLDVYVVDLHIGALLYSHTVDPSHARRFKLLDAWLPGWKDGVAYLRLKGCDDGFLTRYKGCNGERIDIRTHAISAQGTSRVDEAPALRRYQRPAEKEGKSASSRSYVSTREDGVWIVQRGSGARTRLLDADGVRLQEVR